MTVSDPLHHHSPETAHWTTSNLGEALPGVSTPLNATVWADSIDHGLVAGAYGLGAIARKERAVHGPPGTRATAFFHGRAAVNANFLALVGDRMPGTSGQEVVRELFGYVPESMSFHPTARRHPVVAVRLPWTFATHPRRVRPFAAECTAWWSSRTAQLTAADLPTAVAVLSDAHRMLVRAVVVQSVAVMTCVHPAYQALRSLAQDAGIEEISALSSPPGGAESAVVADLWQASRGALDITDVLQRHGFHGPFEGEISSRVWREDPAPLAALIERYAALDDSESPAAREEALARRRSREAADLLAAVGRAKRPAARLTLRVVRSRVPLRGVAKRSMLQSLDVARAAARVIGAELARTGTLADPDDVFYLTLDELVGTLPANPDEVVSARREVRDAHAALTVPEHWQGNPVASSEAATASDCLVVTGEGVCAGVVEGIAHVVDDPTFADIEPGRILVAPTTDPSWASIMFISAALVVDIGGALSHAAVVARELGIPCVVNTRSGSRRLRTGDLVRVDGSAGTVEILRATGSAG